MWSAVLPRTLQVLLLQATGTPLSSIIGARRLEIFILVGYGMCRKRKLFSRHHPTGVPDAHLRRGFSMMRGGRMTTVSLVFDAYQARWMRERQTFHVDEHREDCRTVPCACLFQWVAMAWMP